jgi:hypothetical protein
VVEAIIDTYEAQVIKGTAKKQFVEAIHTHDESYFRTSKHMSWWSKDT